MSGIEMSMWGIVAVFVLFTVIGAVLFVQSLRPSREERQVRAASGRKRMSAREGVRNYYGPATQRHALLGPVRRVALEFVTALCGFPGFGWMMSARPAIGLPLIIVGSATVYGFYPAYLILSGHMNESPYIALQYLPLLALLSAGALAVVEVRASRAVLGDS